MILKAVVINASPRKFWNTGQMMNAVRIGAESAGARTEYVNLYDIDYKGCRGCLACKRKGAERCRCYWNDGLTPVIDAILSSDAVFLGSPIYLGQPNSQFRALFERLVFCMLSYDGGFYFRGKVNVGLVYTMNVTEDVCAELYGPMFRRVEKAFAPLNGKIRTLCAYNTLQVRDYSKYDMSVFDPGDKQTYHDAHFQEDLDAAKELGRELCASGGFPPD